MNPRTTNLSACILRFLVFGISCLIEPANGAVIVVPNPSFRIQSAINAANPGDTILVGAGTYNETLSLSSKQVFVMSMDGAASTRISAGGLGRVIAMTGNGSTVDGFTISGGNESSGAGINIVAGSVSSIIRNNIFENNVQRAGGFGAAIGGNSSSPVIENNIFRGNTSDFQFLSGVVSFANSSSPQIMNNVFYDNSSRAINLSLPSGVNPLVLNNTIDGNSVGIRLDRRVISLGHIIRNNVITNNGIGLEVDFGTEANNPTFQNNLVFGNTTNYDLISSQTGLNGNISADPLFRNAAANDFRLLGLSPAIDAGSSLGAPSRDFIGNLRPADGNGDGVARVDIGAYEAIPEPSGVFTALALMGVLWQRREGISSRRV